MHKKIKFTISVAVGYEELKADGQDTIQKCMERSDKKLYLDKAQSKKQAG